MILTRSVCTYIQVLTIVSNLLDEFLIFLANNRTDFGATAEISCDEKYLAVGKSERDVMKCAKSGWISEEPDFRCVPTTKSCPNIPKEIVSF